MKTLRLALALTVACASPTAPEHYEGACTLGIPRAQPMVNLCYTACPWHAETFAAEGDAAFARVASCQ